SSFGCCRADRNMVAQAIIAILLDRVGSGPILAASSRRKPLHGKLVEPGSPPTFARPRTSSSRRSGPPGAGGGRGRRAAPPPPRSGSSSGRVAALHPTEVPPDIQSFREWDLGEDVQRAIEGMGISVPTPIQKLAIGPVLQGRDVIAKAETGTGKTLAFGAPIL